MASNLYELTKDMLLLQDMLTDPDADEQAVKDTLEGIQFEFDKKAEGYGMVIRNLEADMEAHKKEADRHLKIVTQNANAINRLKEALKRAMELTGQTKVNAGLFKFGIAGNGGKLPLIVDGDVPENFLITRYENDNEKIRKYLDGLENPAACNWARYGERGSHLTIK